MTDAEALRILFPDLPPLPHDDECACGICWRSLCPCCWEDIEWLFEILREDPTRTREQALAILTQRYYPNAPVRIGTSASAATASGQTLAAPAFDATDTDTDSSSAGVPDATSATREHKPA